MKVAMILAAGRGERMRPLTDTLPKPLLRVRGKALIEHHLQNLAASGIQHVVINHAWLGEKLVAALGDGSQFGLSIHYSAEPQALETAGGIIQALPLLKQYMTDNECFLVINGDIFTDIDFAGLPQQLEQQLAHLVLVPNPEHNPGGDFSLQGQQVSRQQKNQFTFSGVAVYHKAMFSQLTGGKAALAPLLFAHAASGQVSGQVHRGYWFDVGTPARLQFINQLEQL